MMLAVGLSYQNLRDWLKNFFLLHCVLNWKYFILANKVDLDESVSSAAFHLGLVK